MAITKVVALQLLGINMKNISKNVVTLWGEIRKLREENPIVNRVITLFGCTDTPVEVQAMHMVVWLCAENKELKERLISKQTKAQGKFLKTEIEDIEPKETNTMRNHLDIVAEIYEALNKGKVEPNALTPLSEKESEKFEPLSEEAIALALKEGKQERDAMEQMAGIGHKPTRYTNGK